MPILKIRNGNGAIYLTKNLSLYSLVYNLLLRNYTLVGIPENSPRYSLGLKSLYLSGIISHTRRTLCKSSKTHDDKILNLYKNGTFIKVPLSNGAPNRKLTIEIQFHDDGQIYVPFDYFPIPLYSHKNPSFSLYFAFFRKKMGHFWDTFVEMKRFFYRFQPHDSLKR